jgi:hypothetical protein
LVVLLTDPALSRVLLSLGSEHLTGDELAHLLYAELAPESDPVLADVLLSIGCDGRGL